MAEIRRAAELSHEELTATPKEAVRNRKTGIVEWDVSGSVPEVILGKVVPDLKGFCP